MILNMDKRNLREGFTLIELLVVISIIGILSVVLYANFGDARQEAKNKAMRSELKETQLALELYKSQNGKYPPAPGCATTALGISIARSSVCGNTPIVGGTLATEKLIPEFITELPTRAKSANSNCDIAYQVDFPNGTWYKLTAVNCHGGATNASSGVQLDDEFARCPSVCPLNGSCIPTNASFYESYAVYSAGGECK